MDYYLKFDSEAAAKSVLYTEVPSAWDNSDPENPVVTETELRPNYSNIDTIGVIYKGGEWDAEGNVITEPVAMDGWHVNVRLPKGEDGTPLEAYAVNVATPMRVWG